MEKDDSAKKKKVASAIALLVLGVVVVGAAISTSSKPMNAVASTANSSQTTTSTTQPTTTPTNSTAQTAYKDGTYNATGSYFSPGGKESLKVTLTLQNSEVVAANVVSGANDPTAISYQLLFIDGYKHSVIGKKINTIKLSNVSGSSLTSQGFNDAVKQIENQAKA